MRNWTVVSTFFCLWLSTQLSPAVQDYVAYSLILTFGVLHGANDLTLIASLRKENQGFVASLVRYLAIVLLVSAVFLLSRTGTLLLFVLISGYHFGEQHFGTSLHKNSPWRPLFFLSYGLTILFMIFFIKMNEVIPIVNEITGLSIGPNFYSYGLVVVGFVFLLQLGYHFITKQIKVNYIEELFMFLVLGIVFYIASLIWAFAIYFIFWHSLPSLRDQLTFLYGRVNRTTFLRYLKTSWWYWLAALLSLTVLYFVLREKVDYFITILLYLLAAITFPHVLVMSKVEALKNANAD
ncbi:MAG: Brp/Blh family beta-carotene 15,15'-dioxygenase [Bacteroidota bacterium]